MKERTQKGREKKRELKIKREGKKIDRFFETENNFYLLCK
jgi:hypothetical protein